MLKLNSTLIRTAALAAIVGGFSIASPVHAAPPPPPDAGDQAMTPDQDDAGTPAKQPMPPMAMKKHGEMDVEGRIQSLHDKLKITPAEEKDWSAVAETMRDNESALHDLIEERRKNGDSMTAVDDLQSYQQIAQAHADGAQKMVAAFKTLYSDLPADQQKNADEVFGRYEGHRGAAGKKPM